MGHLREVDGDAELAGGDGEAVDVVLMLVGDEDGVEGAGVFSGGLHALEDFSATYAGIDEDACAAAGDNGCVALGAGGEHSEADHLLRIARFGLGEMHRWGDDAGTWARIFEWWASCKGFLWACCEVAEKRLFGWFAMKRFW